MSAWFLRRQPDRSPRLTPPARRALRQAKRGHLAARHALVVFVTEWAAGSLDSLPLEEFERQRAALFAQYRSAARELALRRSSRSRSLPAVH